MATWIKADGTEEEVHPADKQFTLDELYKFTSSEMVQVVGLADGRDMWLDEEAKLNSPRKPVNKKATELLAAAGGMTEDQVLGDVLITVTAETEPEDE